MRSVVLPGILLFAAVPGIGAAGEAQLQKSCTACHPLAPIHAARLSRAEWSRELDKMAALGAKVPNRKALLDYLTARYGNAKVARAGN
ncbi:MAG: hypothetical protein M3Z09_06210 [Acidobacteriota bacterium]|nr:hypothetical protein [Acidobacteriota bacterium]